MTTSQAAQQPTATTGNPHARYVIERASDDARLTPTAHRLLEKLALAEEGAPDWRPFDRRAYAELLGVHPETIGDVLRTLARRGYLERRPADRRGAGARIRLTPRPAPADRRERERERERRP